jgi:hypothetical protein
MAGEWTRMHGPSDSAPSVTNQVAKCEVCGATWAVRGAVANEQGCAFCDAPESAIRLVSEAPGYDGRVVLG